MNKLVTPDTELYRVLQRTIGQKVEVFTDLLTTGLSMRFQRGEILHCLFAFDPTRVTGLKVKIEHVWHADAAACVKAPGNGTEIDLYFDPADMPEAPESASRNSVCDYEPCRFGERITTFSTPIGEWVIIHQASEAPADEPFLLRYARQNDAAAEQLLARLRD